MVLALLLFLTGCGAPPPRDPTDLEKIEKAEKEAADQQNHRAGTPTED